MDILKFISEDSIILDVKTKSKKNLLEIISEKMSVLLTTNADMIFEKLYEREKLGTTAFGNGIAIPHARIDNILQPHIMILKLLEPIDFDSDDGKRINLIFSLLVPSEENETHIMLLSDIATMLDNKIFREEIRLAKSSSEIISIIKKYN